MAAEALSHPNQIALNLPRIESQQSAKVAALPQAEQTRSNLIRRVGVGIGGVFGTLSIMSGMASVDLASNGEDSEAMKALAGTAVMIGISTVGFGLEKMYKLESVTTEKSLSETKLDDVYDRPYEQYLFPPELMPMSDGFPIELR